MPLEMSRQAVKNSGHSLEGLQEPSGTCPFHATSYIREMKARS